MASPIIEYYFQHRLYEKRTEMCDIMTRSGSDKGNWHHNYTTLYSYLFTPQRNEVSRIFELGLGTNNTSVPSNMGPNGVPGASLRGWRNWFPHAKVYGADIDKSILFQEDRITTYYCDQRNSEVISKMWEECREPFDIIIEDGLHTFEANKSFFISSIHMVKSGGFFIVEDIQRHEFEKFEALIKDMRDQFAIMELVKIPIAGNYDDNNLLLVQRKTDA